jgi:ABC-type sugar transport system substrate-binding protein
MKKTLLYGMSALLFLISTSLLAENISIGFAHADLNNPYYVDMEKVAYTQAAARGVKITVLNAANDRRCHVPSQSIGAELNSTV